MKKLIAILLCLTFALCLCSCGKENGSKDEPASPDTPAVSDTPVSGTAPAVDGETQEWGNLIVFVPSGFVMKGGSITGVDDEDENQLYIQEDGKLSFDYFSVILSDEETVNGNIEMTKDWNSDAEITDIAETKIGGTTWTGIVYYYADSPIYTLKGVNGGNVFQVGISGYELDSAETQAILASIAAK